MQSRFARISSEEFVKARNTDIMKFSRDNLHYHFSNHL